MVMKKRKVKDWKKEIPWDKYKWAKYATLSKKGTLKLFRDKPMCVTRNGFWWFSKSYHDKPDTFEFEEVLDDFEFNGDWTQTLTKRPKEK